MADEQRIRELWEPTLGPVQTWQTLSAGRTIKPGRAAGDESATLLTDSTADGVSSQARTVLLVPTAGSEAAPDSRPGVAGTPGSALTPSAGFELLDELGRGGMGVVYRARQRSLQRDVAIKMLRPDSRAAPDKFVAEALVSGALDHPNIVPVHELGRDPEGRVFLAMKLVGGVAWDKLLHPETPEQRTRAAELTRGEALPAQLAILLSVCNAVAFAHTRGVLHRDLKPENVMVGEFGEVLVMDWGIAVDMRESPIADARAPHKSTVRGPAGTPAYMAPEQAEGEGDRLGPWTDVFLLGAILHELLTGRPPHHGASLMAVLLKATEPEPPRFGPEVPAALGEICRRALAAAPEDRYATVIAFREALEAWLGHRESLQISARAESELSELQAIAGATGADGPATVDRSRLYSRFAKVVARFEQALELWSGNSAAGRGARAARLAYSEAALTAGDFGLAEAQLEPLVAASRQGAPGEDDPEANADPEATRCLTRVREAAAARERAARSGRRARQAAATLSLLIVLGLAAGIHLIREQQQATAAERDKAVRAEKTAKDERDKARAAETKARDEAEKARREAWRARLAASRAQFHRAIQLARVGRTTEAAARALHAVEQAHPARVPAGFVTADGDPESAWASEAWRLFSVLRPELCRPLWSVSQEVSIPAAALSPRGDCLALARAHFGQAGQTARVDLIDASSGRRIRSLRAAGPKGQNPASMFGDIAFGAAGETLIATVEFVDFGNAKTAGQRGRLIVWSVRTGRVLVSRSMAGAASARLAVSPDGRQAVVAPRSGTVTFLDARTGEVSAALMLETPPGKQSNRDSHVAWSPDGGHIAFAFGPNLSVLDARTHKRVSRRGVGTNLRDLIWLQDSGDLLLTSKKPDLARLDWRRGAIVWKRALEHFEPTSLAVVADLVVVAGGRFVPMFDVASGRRVRTVPGFSQETQFALGTPARPAFAALVTHGVATGFALKEAAAEPEITELARTPVDERGTPRFARTALDSRDGVAACGFVEDPTPTLVHLPTRPKGVRLPVAPAAHFPLGNIDLRGERLTWIHGLVKLSSKRDPAVLCVWNVRTGEVERRIPIKGRGPKDAAIQLVGGLDDRRAIVRVSRLTTFHERYKFWSRDDRYFHTLDLETGRLGPELLQFNIGLVHDARVDPDRDELYIRGLMSLGTAPLVTVYGLDGKMRRSMPTPRSGRSASRWGHTTLVLPRRRDRLLLTRDNRTWILRRSTLETLRRDDTQGPYAISPDGRWGIIGGPRPGLIDLATAALVREPPPGAEVQRVTMVGDRYAILQRTDGRRQLWRWRTDQSERPPASLRALEREVGAKITTDGAARDALVAGGR